MDSVQCVTINIRGDDIVEDDEIFVVTFSSDDDRDTIVYNTTTVTIVDDDGKANSCVGVACGSGMWVWHVSVECGCGVSRI